MLRHAGMNKPISPPSRLTTQLPSRSTKRLNTIFLQKILLQKTLAAYQDASYPQQTERLTLRLSQAPDTFP